MLGVSLELLMLRIPALLIAVTIHEYAHGRVALEFGDPTAQRAGRLTFNPISHLDPIGTLMIILAGFGWAKPVPVNPYNFSDYRKGMLWVSLAGPLSNFAMAFLVVILFRLMAAGDALYGLPYVADFLSVMITLNILLGVFNLIPIPPLDGSKILTSLVPPSKLGAYQAIEPYAPILLLMLLFTGVLGVIIFPLMNIILSIMNTLAGIIFFWT